MASRSPSPRDIRSLLAVYERFRRSRLWQTVDAQDPVAFRFEDDDEPWIAAVMGSGGKEFGLHMMRGPVGLRVLRASEFQDDVDEVDRTARALTQIGFSTARWSDLPRGQRERFQRAGINPRREASVPIVVALDGGSHSSPDARTLRRLVLGTAAILDLHERSEIPWSERPDHDACLLIEVAGEWKAPRAEVAWHDFGIAPRERAPDASSWSPPPPPPETARWRAAENSVIHRTVARMDALGIVCDDTLAQYFGTRDLDAIAEFLQRRRDVLPSLYCWCIEHVRLRKGDKTALESLLDDDLSADERAVVEARLRVAETFVRIVETDPDTGWTRAVDVISGERVRFHDWGVSQSTVPDQVFGVGLVRVADVILPQLAGPLLSPAYVEPAVAFLEEQGLMMTPAGIAKKPHLLGHLWLWVEQRQQAPPPQLANTDGEPLELHDLVLRAEDPGAVTAVLDAHPDVDYDETDGVWVWLRENDERKSAMLGKHVLLGRIEVIGDEVLGSVNSAARAARMRTWLESLPGVCFESMNVHAWGAPRETPLDDRTTAEKHDALPPPEILAEVERRTRAHYLQWVDDPIPALGGKTPRQAVRTKKGRAQVERMIHTLPSTMPGIDMESIRDEIRRALDLE